jgi:hypothetical protein
MIFLVIHVPEVLGTLPVIGVSYIMDTSKTKVRTIYLVTPCMSGCQRVTAISRLSSHGSPGLRCAPNMNKFRGLVAAH